MSDTDILLMVPPAPAASSTPSGTTAAEDVTYDNGGSGLAATDVQAALDELAASITGGLPSLADGKIWIGDGSAIATARTLSGDVTVSNTGVTAIGSGKVTEAMQVLADNTTQNVSTTKHGYAPKAPNDATKYLDGTGAWSVPAGSGGGINAFYPAFTTPVDGDFAWINQGGASVTVNGNGGIYLTAPANGSDSLRIRKKSAPSTPYTVTACFLLDLINSNFQQAGLCFRQSSDGKLVTFASQSGPYEIHSLDWTNATTFSASNATLAKIPHGLMWLRMTDNGTNRILSWSGDGYNFTQLLSETRTTFLTADEVGFFVNAANSSGAGNCTLLSWAQT